MFFFFFFTVVLKSTLQLQCLKGEGTLLLSTARAQTVHLLPPANKHDTYLDNKNCNERSDASILLLLTFYRVLEKWVQ